MSLDRHASSTLAMTTYAVIARRGPHPNPLPEGEGEKAKPKSI